jgi:hypothetical protein
MPIACLLLAAALLIGSAASAQEPAAPALDLPLYDPTQPGMELPAPFVPGAAAPAAAPLLAPAPEGSHELRLEARLIQDGPPLSDGLVWRVYAGETDGYGGLQLLWTARGGAASLRLGAGDYVVHATFGKAGAAQPVTIADADAVAAIVLNAGGLKLDAVAGDGGHIPPDRLSFDVMEDAADEEAGAMVVADADAGALLRLPAGTYHVISRYGDVNSVVRADIEVAAGGLTEAIMRHDAAEVTLKLVSTEGGEALANTSWTVLTAGGDTVHESVGAFPSLVLAEGTYTAVASYEDEIYSRDFTVEAGVDRDVDVRLSDIVRPDAPLSGGPAGVMEP